MIRAARAEQPVEKNALLDRHTCEEPCQLFDEQKTSIWDDVELACKPQRSNWLGDVYTESVHGQVSHVFQYVLSSGVQDLYGSQPMTVDSVGSRIRMDQVYL